MYIAIVGLGASGDGVLKALVDYKNQHSKLPITIHIYDNPEHLRHGFPYQEDSHHLIMNSIPKDLSIDSQNPNDLLDWLKDNYTEYASPSAFIPRSIYGEYLKDRMEAYIGVADVTVIPQFVRDLRPVTNEGLIIEDSLTRKIQYQIQTEDSQWQPTQYDAAFLNIGHPPYADHYQLLGHKGYIHDPYPVAERLGQLDPSKKIGIIGSGLTGLDVMRFMQYHFEGQLERSITFFNRSTPFDTAKQGHYDGQIHASFTRDWLENMAQDNDGYIPLDLILATFQEDMRANHIDIQQMIDQYGSGSLSEIRYELENYDQALQILQQYTGVITPILPDLYMKMPALDRIQFTQEYMPIFEHFRNQMTKEALQDIVDWYDDGRVTFQDQLVDIKPNGQDGFDLTFENGATSHVDILVNAAGFEYDLKRGSEQDDFIKNLLNREILAPTPTGDAMITWPQAQVMSQRFGTQDNLFLTGRWIMSTQYGNNNAQMSFSFGEEIANRFLSRYFQ